MKTLTIKKKALFGCFRLAARVHELRAEGHRIESRTVETQGGKKVEEYSV